MRFLLRMAFWMTVVLVLLPSRGSQPTPKTNVSALEAMSAAIATVGDMRSFCERQPEACIVGSQAATVIGQRAQAGARMLYDYLSHRPDASAGTTTRSAPAAAPSQHTLTPADLAPPWRGPPARKERQA
ncbi:MAG: hypothetical protein C5B56_07415 [Proteobacteria bacterium]|nr:MAG: hypothetical protein C5B56_07415 [Pseudomonadota bacterium]